MRPVGASSITSPKASKQLLILPGGDGEGPSGWSLWKVKQYKEIKTNSKVSYLAQKGPLWRMKTAQVGIDPMSRGATRCPAQKPATPGLTLKQKTCTAELFSLLNYSYTMTDKGIMLGRHSISFPKRNNSSAIFISLLQGSQEEESGRQKDKLCSSLWRVPP